MIMLKPVNQSIIQLLYNFQYIWNPGAKSSCGCLDHGLRISAKCDNQWIYEEKDIIVLFLMNQQFNRKNSAALLFRMKGYM